MKSHAWRVGGIALAVRLSMTALPVRADETAPAARSLADKAA
ncbi:MAG: hypothetical protein R3E69_03175 [Steroidobacteraceae bacterium]